MTSPTVNAPARAPEAVPWPRALLWILLAGAAVRLLLWAWFDGELDRTGIYAVMHDP